VLQITDFKTVWLIQGPGKLKVLLVIRNPHIPVSCPWRKAQLYWAWKRVFPPRMANGVLTNLVFFASSAQTLLLAHERRVRCAIRKGTFRTGGLVETERKQVCFLSQGVLAKSLQLCPILCEPTDCSPPGSSVHGILQARILEWVFMPSSRGSSQAKGILKAQSAFKSYKRNSVPFFLLLFFKPSPAPSLPMPFLNSVTTLSSHFTNKSCIC